MLKSFYNYQLQTSSKLLTGNTKLMRDSNSSCDVRMFCVNYSVLNFRSCIEMRIQIQSERQRRTELTS